MCTSAIIALVLLYLVIGFICCKLTDAYGLGGYLLMIADPQHGGRAMGIIAFSMVPLLIAIWPIALLAFAIKKESVGWGIGCIVLGLAWITGHRD